MRESPRSSEPTWTVDFWFDPSCPLTRITSRWVRQVADEIPLRVVWHVMSLSVLNEDRDDDPEGDSDGYLWIPARIATAVQTEHGHDALGAFHEALWADAERGEGDWIGDSARVLDAAGLPASLADAGTSSAYDAALRASHHAAVDSIDAEVGSPILRLTDLGGKQRAFFGPVIDAVPAREETMRLWDALTLLHHVPHYRELKA